MIIFGHRSIESFRRELSRNSQLRIACGLSKVKYKYCGERKHLVPSARVLTGFLNKLKKHKREIEKIKEKDIKFMYENLEGFREDCAVDGKYLDTYANQFHKSKAKKENNERADMMQQVHVKHILWRMEVRKMNGIMDLEHISSVSKIWVTKKSKVTPANNSEQTELDNM